MSADAPRGVDFRTRTGESLASLGANPSARCRLTSRHSRGSHQLGLPVAASRGSDLAPYLQSAKVLRMASRLHRPQNRPTKTRRRARVKQKQKGVTKWRNSLCMPVDSVTARMPELWRPRSVRMPSRTERASVAIAWSNSSVGVRRTRKRWRAERTVPAQLRTPKRADRSIRRWGRYSPRRRACALPAWSRRGCWLCARGVTPRDFAF